ncbi:hypothetical protein [Zhongshania aquimaris]|uniref:Uncharacterized protein n=1 Tax=Zhongshania aquimaris TaxID=2857107 RepID=A0ABS6VW09_9GAMM|nr:hypothetical protein [Zhongshania aquimaris]MBW2942466.1 hypothetical protein [Zhongshania aquimaris]
MKNRIFTLMMAAVLAACATTGDETISSSTKKSPYPPAAALSPVQDGEALLQRNDDVFTLYLFVDYLHAGGDMGVALNGFPSTLALQLNNVMVGNFLTGQAIKLELLPNQDYSFAVKNTFFGKDSGKTELPLKTGGAGEWAAWTSTDPLFVGNEPKLEALSWDEVRDKAKKEYTFVEPYIARAALALKPSSIPARLKDCSQTDDAALCQSGLISEMPASLRSGDVSEIVAAILDDGATPLVAAASGGLPAAKSLTTAPLPAAPATTGINYEDPLFQPLSGIDLSQYKSAGDGLLLIGRKGEYELLLTEPGARYEVYRDTAGAPGPKGRKFYSGYLLRWKKNQGEPMPYIGRLTMYGKDGSRAVYTGAFSALYYEEHWLSQTLANARLFKQGIEERYDSAKVLTRKRYLINRYHTYYNKYDEYRDYLASTELTDRKILLTSAEGKKRAIYTEVSGLPGFEFVLPAPEQLTSLASWKTDRGLFTREYSLFDLFKSRGINADRLLLRPFEPTQTKSNVYETTGPRHAWINKGQSAFVYSAMTGKTYLQAYQKAPALTLPELKEIVINGQLSVNQQCLGKTQGMVVLSGQCDPNTPQFPLTVMTQLSATQYVINVWSDIDRRSVYLLTGGQFPKEEFYRWSVDAFMIEQAVESEVTLTALATGKDSFSDKLVQFASQGRDQQSCSKMVAAVTDAEKALSFDPDIERRLSKYEYVLDDFWGDMGAAINRISVKHTPVTDFKEYVWDDLVGMEKDVAQRLDTLNRYKDVNNSACQPDSESMGQLVTALSDFKQDLSDLLDQLDRSYYKQASDLSNDIYYWSNRLEEAKRNAALAQFLGKLQSSLNADRVAKKAQRESMDRSIAAARKSVDDQIADVKARNAVYLASQHSVVKQPANTIIVPVAMPSKSLDTTGGGSVYINGKVSNRLSTKDAIAQAQAKTKRLEDERQANVMGAGSSSVAAAAASVVNTTKGGGDGGAAVCVATGRNGNNINTDLAYVYTFDRNITPLKADGLARQLHAAEHNTTPSCERNDANQIGALVVVVWQGKDYSGATKRTYGMGFGQSIGAAELDAVKNLANRNWSWSSSMGYKVEFAKQY